MKRITRMDLDAETPIYIEVEEIARSEGFEESSLETDRASSLASTLEQSLVSIKPAVAKIKSLLNDLNHPDAIELQFGIKVVGGVGAVFASVSTEANFTVKLNWTSAKKEA